MLSMSLIVFLTESKWEESRSEQEYSVGIGASLFAFLVGICQRDFLNNADATAVQHLCMSPKLTTD